MEAIDRRVDALRGGIECRSREGRLGAGDGETVRDGSVEHSFKNKGAAKTQAPSSSVNPVGAKICLRRRSWSQGSRGRRRDLQKKSKPEGGLLR